MKNDANNVLVDQDGLYGDGPGAAVVTIEVDGRRLQLPRSTLINILNSAGNRASAERLKMEVKTRDMNYEVDHRYWADLESFCEQINKFARSSR